MVDFEMINGPDGRFALCETSTGDVFIAVGHYMKTLDKKPAATGFYGKSKTTDAFRDQLSEQWPNLFPRKARRHNLYLVETVAACHPEDEWLQSLIQDKDEEHAVPVLRKRQREPEPVLTKEDVRAIFCEELQDTLRLDYVRDHEAAWKLEFHQAEVCSKESLKQELDTTKEELKRLKREIAALVHFE
jgi:hypothetical protein